MSSWSDKLVPFLGNLIHRAGRFRRRVSSLGFRRVEHFSTALTNLNAASMIA